MKVPFVPLKRTTFPEPYPAAYAGPHGKGLKALGLKPIRDDDDDD